MELVPGFTGGERPSRSGAVGTHHENGIEVSAIVRAELAIAHEREGAILWRSDLEMVRVVAVHPVGDENVLVDIERRIEPLHSEKVRDHGDIASVVEIH